MSGISLDVNRITKNGCFFCLYHSTPAREIISCHMPIILAHFHFFRSQFFVIIHWSILFFEKRNPQTSHTRLLLPHSHSVTLWLSLTYTLLGNTGAKEQPSSCSVDETRDRCPDVVCIHVWIILFTCAEVCLCVCVCMHLCMRGTHTAVNACLFLV